MGGSGSIIFRIRSGSRLGRGIPIRIRTERTRIRTLPTAAEEWEQWGDQWHLQAEGAGIEFHLAPYSSPGTQQRRSGASGESMGTAKRKRQEERQWVEVESDGEGNYRDVSRLKWIVDEEERPPPRNRDEETATGPPQASSAAEEPRPSPSRAAGNWMQQVYLKLLYCYYYWKT